MQQPAGTTKHRARDHSSRNGQRIRKGVIHATAGTNSLSWLEGNPKQTSIHVLITKEGYCYQMVDDDRAAHHVGFSRLVLEGVVYSEFGPHNCNEITLGIELENENTGKDPYPLVQLQAAAWWIDHWNKTHGLAPSDWLMHRDIDQHGKTDAAGLTIDKILALIPTDGGTPPGTNITRDSSIIGPVSGTAAQAATYLTKRGTHPSYTHEDHVIIADYYWSIGKLGNVDALLAFAQMVHETGGLTSWWSLRDARNPAAGRRNPAGLGVTGETSRSRGRPGMDWAQDEKSKLWKRGCSFSRWELSVKAHLGHLLCYAIHPSDLNDAQRGLIAADPRAQAVSAGARGSAPTLAGLEGRWAVPGVGYADKIATIANAILAV